MHIVMKENSLCIHPEFWKILLKCKLSKIDSDPLQTCMTTISHDSTQKLFLIFHFMWYLLHQAFQCISSYGFENNTSLLITSLSSQSTNDLSSSLWFKNVDTDYWSLNNEYNQERMTTKMSLIKMCGMAIPTLRNSRQYTWAFLSLTYSVVKLNG